MKKKDKHFHNLVSKTYIKNNYNQYDNYDLHFYWFIKSIANCYYLYETKF